MTAPSLYRYVESSLHARLVRALRRHHTGSTGHCDPRVIESGQLFGATLLHWLGPIGLDGDRARITEILDAELAAG